MRVEGRLPGPDPTGRGSLRRGAWAIGPIKVGAYWPNVDPGSPGQETARGGREYRGSAGVAPVRGERRRVVATTLTLNVNGVNRTVTVPTTDMPLLWVLRDLLGLTGTKYGCAIEVCGACTVIMDNQREHSCVVNVGSCVGKKIVTIEGLSADNSNAVQKAWIDNQVPQCGYCQPGMIMAAEASRRAGHHGKEILADCPHLCVCGTYQRIKTAVEGL